MRAPIRPILSLRQATILTVLVGISALAGCASNPGPVDGSNVRRDQYGTWVIDQPGTSDADLRRSVLGTPTTAK